VARHIVIPHVTDIMKGTVQLMDGSPSTHLMHSWWTGSRSSLSQRVHPSESKTGQVFYTGANYGVRPFCLPFDELRVERFLNA